MAQRIQLTDILDRDEFHKILVFSVIMLLFLELAIYLGAAGKAGSQSWVTVYDKQGNKIYETQGDLLTSYERLVFEETFGPLSDYRIAVETRHDPFPFRGWLATAIGAPIGLVLLLAFLVRAYLALISGEESEKDVQEKDRASPNEAKFPGSFLDIFRRLSIFHLGFLAVIVVLLLWLVPNLVIDFSKATMSLIFEYRWFFLGVSVFTGFLVVWMIYLRYKLSQKMLDNQLNLQKFQFEEQLILERDSRLAISSGADWQGREQNQAELPYLGEETAQDDFDGTSKHTD